MNTPCRTVSGLPLLVASFFASELRAEFTAYNDIASGPATHANTTTYSSDSGAPASGLLKDIGTGDETAVTLTVSDQGVSFESSTGVPAAGTDAARIFGGFVDFSTGHRHSLAVSGGDTFTYTFSGLDPASRYEFVGTACRGNAPYTNRWAQVTIEGAESFEVAHSDGEGIITDGFGADELAFWGGANHEADQGWVVQWTDIVPGADGNFSVVSRQYSGTTPFGSADGSKGYALSGIRLKESFIEGQPLVSNGGADDVTVNGATIGGEVTDIGAEVPEVTVYWGDEDGGARVDGWDQAVVLGEQAGAFSTVIGGLSPATTYFFRAYAENAVAGSWGTPTVEFETLAQPPAVETGLAVEPMLATTVTVQGTVTETGGVVPSVRLYYGESNGGTEEGDWENSIDLGIREGAIEATMDGLEPATEYYYRFRAENTGGVVWSDQFGRLVTPEVALPSVENRPVTGVTGISAVLAGEVTGLGADPPDVTIYYGKSDGGEDAGRWDAFVELGERRGGFTSFVGNLDPEATYYFRAVASNAAGSVWASGAVSFVTPEYTPPTIVINEIHYDEDDKTRQAEFIEIYNLSDEPVDVSGWRLTGGVDYLIPDGTLIGADGYLVLAENPGVVRSLFGLVGASGPWQGKLSNGGETLRLRDRSGNVLSQVDYRLGYPWPTVGDPTGNPAASPSIQLINPLLVTDLGGSWRSGRPTPGARNIVYSENAPPQTRQVKHLPKQPAPGEEVVVTVKVTDPDGVGAVGLSYQTVEPGDYFCRYQKFSSNGSANLDPRYERADEWTSVVMNDDGAGGDELSGDGVYSVTMPGAMQEHRRLVRYRITVEDSAGNIVRVPYADDPAPNFAYFVYGETPDWTGRIRSGDTPVTFSGELLSSIPTYYLLSRSAWVDDSQFGGYRGSEYLWPGTMVYDGEVYDHIQYRPRGGVHRFQYGKNFWKFDFPRGHRFQASDNYGREYKTEWDKLNFSSIVQQVNFRHRGEQGLFEGVGFRLFELAGVGACKTHHVQFYVIDQASETGAGQYESDYYGLFLAIEQMDGQYLEEHGLPDGNLYKIEGHSGSSNNQGPTQVSNRSDVSSFISGYRNGNPDETWWRENLDIEKYLSYRTIVEGIHHYDIAGGKNYFYYHNPETDLFEVHPWDLDLTWADNMFGSGNHDFKSDVAGNSAFNTQYQNRVREIMDLLYNTEDGWHLIDEVAKPVYTPGELSLVDADRRLWDNNPRLNHPDRYYDEARTRNFAGMVQLTKDYIVSRGNWMRSNLLRNENQVPRKPTLAFVGEAGFPTDDLRFESGGYSSPGGSAFSAMEWRLAEVYNPDVTGYDPALPNRYEIEGSFDSGELDQFGSEFQYPTNEVRPGRTYRARVRHQDTAGRWSHWSNAVEFVATAPDVSDYTRNLWITEFMYHPAAPTGGELAVSSDQDDFEFIELKNVGVEVLDLGDVRFTKGVDFDFAGSAIESLAAGEFVVVVRNLAAFEARYGAGLPVAGEYGGDSLSNGGERLKLSFGAGTAIHDIDPYGDAAPWPGAADGSGASLVLIVGNGGEAPDHSVAANWRASSVPDGTPGRNEEDAGDAYAGWKAANGVVDDLGDGDGDGVLDVFEFFFNADVSVADSGVLPAISVDGGDARVVFLRREDVGGLGYVVEFSSDLETWEDGGTLVRQTANGDGTVTEVWDGGSGNLFARVRVTIP